MQSTEERLRHIGIMEELHTKVEILTEKVKQLRIESQAKDAYIEFLEGKTKTMFHTFNEPAEPNELDVGPAVQPSTPPPQHPMVGYGK